MTGFPTGLSYVPVNLSWHQNQITVKISNFTGRGCICAIQYSRSFLSAVSSFRIRSAPAHVNNSSSYRRPIVRYCRHIVSVAGEKEAVRKSNSIESLHMSNPHKSTTIKIFGGILERTWTDQPIPMDIHHHSITTSVGMSHNHMAQNQGLVQIPLFFMGSCGLFSVDFMYPLCALVPFRLWRI